MAASRPEATRRSVERLIDWATDEGVRVKKTVPRVAGLEGERREEAKLAAGIKPSKRSVSRSDAIASDSAQLRRRDSSRTRTKRASRALDKLAKRLPKTAKRLKRLSPEQRPPAAGSVQVGDDEGRADDGHEAGRRRTSVVERVRRWRDWRRGDPRDEARAARGADELTAFAAAHDGYLPIARTDHDKGVFVTDKGAPLYRGEPGGGSYEVIRSFKSLDAALDHVLKKGTC